MSGLPMLVRPSTAAQATHPYTPARSHPARPTSYLLARV